jgi:hypothetical protein
VWEVWFCIQSLMDLFPMNSRCHLVCKTLLKLDKMMATTLRPDRSPSHHVCSLFTELPNLHWRDIVDNLHCEYC